MAKIQVILDWQGITIHTRYNPDASPAMREIYGQPLAHLELDSPEPLSVTETGYRSHFTSPEDIAACGGPVTYTREWLDYEAQSPQWQEYKAKAAQMTLF